MAPHLIVKVSWWNILRGLSERIRGQETISTHGMRHLRMLHLPGVGGTEGLEEGERGGLMGLSFAHSLRTVA